MLSKNTLKFIKSLQQKKFRKQENAFFVEGAKNVTELLQSDFEITHLLFTEKFAGLHNEKVEAFQGAKYPVSQKLLEQAGSFQSNDSALAVAKIKANSKLVVQKGELAIALDEIRDPGNLGTIIRIADWYGIRKLILSGNTADFYNPKVLNASMGSFTRVMFYYTGLQEYFREITVPIYGAFLDGENIHHQPLTKDGIIVMGNESNGISKELEPFISQRISIPAFGKAESLNVAIATAVICDNFRRS